MAISIQIGAGVVLALTGVAAMMGQLRLLANFSYPVIWWGVLLLLDVWNARRWGSVPMHGNGRHFVAVTLPLSVLFWLVYEFLNLRFPQWRYVGEPEGAWVQMLFGFIAYGTVIPIIVELQWWIIGPEPRWVLPDAMVQGFRRRRALCLATGAAMLALPAFVRIFWLNQLMWIAPAVLLAPFLPVSCGHSPRRVATFAGSVAAAGIGGGLLWELFNYWSPAKWKYLVMPGAAHLFEMPLAGYLGFVPFAFSTVAVYKWQSRVPARFSVSAALYALTFAALYVFVKLYAESETQFGT
jgi:hypothetical protein